jgi:hypothetical protein
LADRRPQAFWSYTRFDDNHARGYLSALRSRLEDELRAQLGTSFAIFQDTLDLTWGAQWQQRLLASIDEAIFFIPLISPSYFERAACRTELEVFLRREQILLYEELILPVYWISVKRSDDDLAGTIMSRNYVDCRELRLTPIDSPAMDRKIVEIASQLIKRLDEFNDHQRQTKNIKVTITNPRNHDRVSRHVTVKGTTENVPRDVILWQVVEAGGKYHPEASITTGNWKKVATIGSKGFGASDNHDFPIHVIATTKTANYKFTSYIAEQQKLRLWQGLTLPAGTRVLATTTVRRDDYAVALADSVGTYDEYRAKPLQTTKGIITVRVTPHGDPRTISTDEPLRISRASVAVPHSPVTSRPGCVANPAVS